MMLTRASTIRLSLATLILSASWSMSAFAQLKIGPSRLLLTTQDWPPYQSYENATMQGIA